VKIRNLDLSTKGRSKRSEKRAALFLSGRVQPASGALPSPSLKGDILTEQFLVDDKITARNSYGIGVALWRKLANESRQLSRHPMLRVCFTDGPTLYVIDEPALAELLEGTKPCPSSLKHKPLPLRKKFRKA